MRRCLGVVCVLLASATLFARDRELRILNHAEKVFQNTNCQATNTCDLLQVDYRVEDYTIGVAGGLNYGTRLFARYETKTVDDIPNYVFIQFFQGCVYDTTYIRRGGVRVDFCWTNYHFGESLLFRFLDWVIDSDSNNPTYSSDPGSSRYRLLKWNLVTNSFDEATRQFYEIVRPQFPKVYVTDRPASAFFADKAATNVSLQFKMCLYRATDVPETVPNDQSLNPANALYCFDWDAIWLYDHDAYVFRRSHDMSPFCSLTP